LQKRKEKMDNEMSTLYQQIQSLEIKKNEYERMNRSLVDQNNLNLSQHREDEAINAQLNSQNSFHSTKKDSNMILELKTENKLLTKKLDEIKSKYEKEINGLKNDISTKDSRIKEVEVTFNKIDKELKEKSESYSNMKIEYDMCKDKIQDMKGKLEQLNKNNKLHEYEQEINKMKIEFENNVKKKDLELKELKETLDTSVSQIERIKKWKKP